MGEGSEGPPVRRRREKREEVRSKILAAAVDVFSQRGYEGASLDKVAEAAGFSKGAVYSNFAGKDELFFELVATRIDQRLEAVGAATARRPSKVRGSFWAISAGPYPARQWSLAAS